MTQHCNTKRSISSIPPSRDFPHSVTVLQMDVTEPWLWQGLRLPFVSCVSCLYIHIFPTSQCGVELRPVGRWADDGKEPATIILTQKPADNLKHATLLPSCFPKRRCHFLSKWLNTTVGGGRGWTSSLLKALDSYTCFRCFASASWDVCPSDQSSGVAII